MKNFMTLALLFTFVSFSAFAQGEGEATTECPGMRESNKRENNKINISQDLVSVKSLSKKGKSE